MNSYVLMAGGLLLLGGRLSDLLGRRRTFLIGAAVFGLASFTSGSAQSSAVLVASRFGQGLGEALSAPAGLSIIAMLFTDAGERRKAIGLWTGLAAIGGTLGTVLSGVINDVASWRWIFYINVPVIVFSLVTVPWLVPESRASDATRQRPDVLGGLLATVGMVSLVYGLLQVSSRSWGSLRVVLPVVGGTLLLVTFVAVERLTPSPLVPLSFFRVASRNTTFAASLLFASGFFTMFFLVTLYAQNVLGWSALKTGLAYLPSGLLIILGAGAATALVPKLGARTVLFTGCLGAALGLLLLPGISADGSYVADLLSGLLVVGVGAGLTFPTLGIGSLHEVSGENAGLASGVQTAVYQVGGALGLAVLLAIALRHLRHAVSAGADPAVAVTDGYALAFQVGAGIMALSAALVAALMGHRVGMSDTAAAAPAPTAPQASPMTPDGRHGQPGDRHASP